ncbi:multiheme c-type cytochrome [Rubripirellula amarantea]|nr:multiheme c-type cytochrome [Rubripirellula amarantea]
MASSKRTKKRRTASSSSLEPTREEGIGVPGARRDRTTLLVRWHFVVGLSVFALLGALLLWRSFFAEQPPSDLTRWQARLTSSPQPPGIIASESNRDDGKSALQGSFADYVGMQSCKDCHPDQYASYQTTTHAKSFRTTSAVSEPANGKLFHEPSNRVYESWSKDDELVHREVILGNEGKPVSKVDRAINFTVGSGTHAHTYLCVEDGFLVESPITWYAGGEGWGMSPGYDHGSQASFTRQVEGSCLFCHVGMIKTSEDNSAKVEIVEQQIGCERCHGPGRDHVELYENFSNVENGDHPSEHLIVHPGKLPQSALEAICQQCHLQGFALVPATGQTVWDFRPGQLLEENRTDFQFEGNKESKIVGHVEQMHESKCYTASGMMTCITCHDPHHQHPKTERVAFYRSVCLTCHGDNDCGLTMEVRHIRADNDCAQCHMPKRPTNVSHAALHDHRIRIPGAPEDPTSEVLLVESVLGYDQLSEQEIDRRQAIAVQAALSKKPESELSSDQLAASVQTMLKYLEGEERDPVVDATMANYAANVGNIQYAIDLSKRVLKNTQPGASTRCDAIVVLASSLFSEGKNAEAMEYYRQLTVERRNVTDHVMLALCLRNSGEIERAIESLERALVIDPGFSLAHEEMYTLLKDRDPERAQMHLDVVQALSAKAD